MNTNQSLIAQNRLFKILKKLSKFKDLLVHDFNLELVHKLREQSTHIKGRYKRVPYKKLQKKIKNNSLTTVN